MGQDAAHICANSDHCVKTLLTLCTHLSAPVDVIPALQLLQTGGVELVLWVSRVLLYR